MFKKKIKEKVCVEGGMVRNLLDTNRTTVSSLFLGSVVTVTLSQKTEKFSHVCVTLVEPT